MPTTHLSSDSGKAYDEVAYPEVLVSASHPDRLATVAVTHGLTPAPVERCRVLELGCASGANLIPMADALRGSEFVGIDYSKRQIETGRAIVSEAELSNIELVHKSIAAVGAEIGKFDYIVCHGVYSWVAEEIRAKVLEICRENLAENGVAFVSYNTLPGWSMRSIARRMMRYHVRDIEDPKQRIARGRGFLEFVARSVPENRRNYGAWLKEEVEAVRAAADGYLHHEHLEETNDAFYFSEFIKRAEEHGLQFLSEAQAYTMHGNDLSPQIKEQVRRMGDVIEQQQVLDFIRSRIFRQTLLCHKGQEVKWEFDPKRLEGLYVASSAKPGPNVRLDAMTNDEFFAGPGVRFTTPFPAAKAMVVALSKVYPNRISFDELSRLPEVARAKAPAAGGIDSMAAAASLLWELYMHNAAEFYPRASDFVTTVSERPKVRGLARVQARKTNNVAGMLHKAVALDELTRRLLPLMDGTRDVEALTEELDQFIEKGSLPGAEQMMAMARGQRRDAERKILMDILNKLAAAALLVA